MSDKMSDDIAALIAQWRTLETGHASEFGTTCAVVVFREGNRIGVVVASRDDHVFTASPTAAIDKLLEYRLPLSPDKESKDASAYVNALAALIEMAAPRMPPGGAFLVAGNTVHGVLHGIYTWNNNMNKLAKMAAEKTAIPGPSVN